MSIKASQHRYTIIKDTNGSLCVKDIVSVGSGGEKSKGRRTSPSSKRLKIIKNSFKKRYFFQRIRLTQ